MTVPAAFTLSNGVTMPAIGYGTYRSTESDSTDVLRAALAAGYRLLDTAAFYHNEALVGRAIRESGLPRQELFLTSKVWPTELGYEKTMASFSASLERLGTDYLDLFLLHWPKPSPDCPDWQALDADSWRALEELYRQGKVRAIGVSNFLPHHLAPLLEHAQVRPMVNQLELHVGYLQESAVAYCKDQRIQLQAWSPLGRQRLLQLPVVLAMAERYQVTPAQLLLRFLLQQDIAVIPKASAPERLRQNLELPDFTLRFEDLSMLRCLPQTGWGGEHPDLPKVPPQA